MQWVLHLHLDISCACSLSQYACSFITVINRKISEVRKRGFEYERGRIVVYIFRVDQVSELETNAVQALRQCRSSELDATTREVIPAPEDSPWHVEVRTAPVRNQPTSTVDPASRAIGNERATIEEQIDAVLEFKDAMKGLLDLVPFPS